MTVSSRRGHYRYQFWYQGIRYSKEPFRTRREALSAELRHKEELKNPSPQPKVVMAFGELMEKRMDYVQAHHTKIYYDAYRFMGMRWVHEWKDYPCDEITRNMIETFLLKRAEISPHASNKDLRYIKAAFNWGIEQELIETNPAAKIKKLPIEKHKKYVPPKEDVWKILKLASGEVADYLWCIILTLARMNEINNLKWEHVHFDGRHVVLFTRKKKGGDYTPRSIHMVSKLHEILWRRYQARDESKPWVFHQRWWDNKSGEFKEGPFINRSRIMRTLCSRAGVQYFRFHALRHFGASVMKGLNLDERFIQESLGHEKLSTTHIYLASVSQGAVEAMERFEKEIMEDSSVLLEYEKQLEEE